MKGGADLTIKDIIQDVLSSEDTSPLIKAIIKHDVDTFIRLANNQNVNEPDKKYKWCPYKWAVFVYLYNHRNFYKFTEMKFRLNDKYSKPCFESGDDNVSIPRRFNFVEVIPKNEENYFKNDTDSDAEEEEKTRRYNDFLTRSQNTRTGGKRIQKSKKSKKSKNRRKTTLRKVNRK